MKNTLFNRAFGGIEFYPKSHLFKYKDLQRAQNKKESLEIEFMNQKQILKEWNKYVEYIDVCNEYYKEVANISLSYEAKKQALNSSALGLTKKELEKHPPKKKFNIISLIKRVFK